MTTLALALLKDLRVTDGDHGLDWTSDSLDRLPDPKHHAMFVQGLKNALVTDWILAESGILRDWYRDDIATSGLCTDCHCLSAQRHTTQDGMVCDDCRSQYSACERCGDVIADSRWSGDYVDGEWWCGSCVSAHAFGCNHCGNIFPTSANFGDRYCEACYYEQVSHCENCESDWHASESDDCPDCGGYRDDVWCSSFVAIDTHLGTLGECERLIATIGSEEYTRSALRDVVSFVIADMRMARLESFQYHEVRNIVEGLADSTMLYSRRLKRAIYARFGHNLKSDTLGAIGSLLSLDLQRSGTFSVTVARNLNGYAVEFGNPTSCLYGGSWGYRDGLDAIAELGTYALRDWRGSDHNPVGRIWMTPIAITDESEECVHATGSDDFDGFIFYNGYGTLAEKRSAGLICELFGSDPISVNYKLESGAYQNSKRCLYVGSDRSMNKFVGKSLSVA